MCNVRLQKQALFAARIEPKINLKLTKQKTDESGVTTKFQKKLEYELISRLAIITKRESIQRHSCSGRLNTERPRR